LRLFFTGDWHLRDYQSDKFYEYTIGDNEKIFIGERLFNKLKSMDEVANIVKENTPKSQERPILFVLGDVKHLPYTIDVNSLTCLLDYLDRHTEVDFYFLTGNHDLNSEDEHATNFLYSLKDKSNAFVVGMHEIKRFDLDDRIYLLPYNPNLPKMFEKLAEEMADDGYDNTQRILLSHLSVNGFLMNDAFRSNSKLKGSDLRKFFKYVFLNHFHKPQDEDGIFYVGSICQENWGEIGEEKRILELDTETYEVIEHKLNSYKKYLRLDYKEFDKEKIDVYKNNYILEIVNCSPGDDIQILQDNDIRYKMNTSELISDFSGNSIEEDLSEEEKFKSYMLLNGVEEKDLEIYMSFFKEKILSICENMISSDEESK